MNKITKRTAAIGTASVLGLAALGGVAMANGWLVGGTGTATGSTSAVRPLSATVNLGEKLYPGFTAKVDAAVTNTNDFAVVLGTTVTPTGVTVAGPKSEDADACKASLIASPTTLQTTVPANTKVPSGATRMTVPVTVLVQNTLNQKCADSTINITYTFTGTSAA